MIPATLDGPDTLAPPAPPAGAVAAGLRGNVPQTVCPNLDELPIPGALLTGLPPAIEGPAPTTCHVCAFAVLP